MRRPALFVIFLLFCALVLLPGGVGAAPRAAQPALRVLGVDDRPALRAELQRLATNARLRIRAATDLDWSGTARVVWASEKEFEAQTGFRPHHVAAAASPRHATIWINAARWPSLSQGAQQETMTHEVAHLLVGALPGGVELPLWANEGVVMHLAGQWSLEDQAALHSAHLFGMLPSLGTLEDEFPRTGESQALAYRTGYAAVSVLAQSYGDEPASVRRLLWRLADPNYGPALARELRDGFRREGLDIATSHALGSRLTTGVIVFTGSGALLVGIALLVVVAWFRMRQRREEWNRREEQEESWAQSLTEDDVQDLYGDREGRWTPEHEDDDEGAGRPSSGRR